MRRIFAGAALLLLITFAGLNMGTAGAIIFDELGRVLDPEEAFHINNPPPSGQSRQLIPEIDAYDHLGHTKLTQAAAYRQQAEAEKWLKAGANPNILNARGRSPLEIAARNDDLPMAELLLKHQAGANLGLPLSYAKSAAMRELLQKHGATQNERPKPKKAIQLFDYSDSEELTKILNEEKRSGELSASVVVAVMLERSPEIITGLLEKGGNINEVHPVFGTTLEQAIVQGHDADYFAFLLKAGADPDLDRGYSRRPLYKAISANRADLARLLLEAGAKIKPENSNSDNHLLMRAVRNGDTAVARLLLEHGADPDETIIGKDGRVEDPLLIQSVFYRASNADMTRLLLEFGADPKPRGPKRLNALAVVDWNDYRLDTVMALLEGGVPAADKSIYAEKHETLLHWAIARNDSKLFQAALKAGTDVTRRDRDMETPLYQAVRRGSPEFTRALLEAGAPVNKSVTYPGQRFQDYSRTYAGRDDLLAQAVAGGSLEVVEILLAAGVDLNTQGNNYNFSTALHLAAEKKRADITARLLTAGAKVDPLDRHKRTPLARAVEMGDLRSVTLLVAAGANPNLRDEDQESPLDLAGKRLDYPEENKKTAALIFELLRAAAK